MSYFTNKNDELGGLDLNMAAAATLFSFCTLKHIDDFVIEITPDCGVELGDVEMAALYRYVKNLGKRFGILWVRQNSYSYSFGALTNMARFDMISAAAVLLTDTTDRKKTEYIKSVMEVAYPSKTFTQKQAALNWLYQYR